VFRETGDYLYDYSADGGPSRVLNQDDLRADRWGVDLGAQRTVFDRHRIAFGAEFVDTWRIDIRNGDRSPRETYIDERRSAVDWGLYLQDEWSITDELSLLVGVRYDETDFGGGSTTPRAALIWTPRTDTAFKLLYGEAFRAPTAYELFYNDGGLSQTAPGSLSPETVRSLEVVAEHQIDDHWRVGASLYAADYDDLVALVGDDAADVVVFQNFSSARSYGMELRLEARWPGGFESSLSYAVQRTEDGDRRDRLINSPLQLARLNVIAPLWRERVFLGFELQYTDDRATWDGRGADAFFLANLALLYRPRGLPIEISAGVKNVLDEKYADPVSEEIPEATVEQDGRTFFVRAWLRF
jgi:iron complex outermembrane receptor protein